MGGAASIENSALENIDYDALEASGVDFGMAYKAIQKKIGKGKSANVSKDTSINFLAIRQLSQNLKNQEHLERTKRRVLKSRSLPNNLKYKLKALESDINVDYALHHTAVGSLTSGEEFDARDLAIIQDHEFDVSSDVPTKHNSSTLTAISKEKKGKPALFLRVDSDDSSKNNSGNNTISQIAADRLPPISAQTEVPSGRPPSPSSNMRLSPHGTLHMGKWKIKENGIFLSESVRGFDTSFREQKQQQQQHHSETASLAHPKNLSANHSISRMVPPVALGGKNDFIVVATLGSGASGVVSEAIHLPTLTLVALKMLPVYNQQKRQHVSRELGVLYRNLADLRLVDDRLNGADSVDEQGGRGKGSSAQQQSSRCVNVLSLYNAFVDPKSGMINLVIEYMDGGSLEDLVTQGGCRDERVLADIAFQTCKGLCFLHRHKSVHRDIKPANILCSSNGVIKIADFGISKALDKTSGFANSFVGTVCYMSPERIVGDTYSFPCDIWSLGLTLLAVAKGHFPLSGKEGGDSSPDSRGGDKRSGNAAKGPFDESPPAAGNRNAPIGGAGGYWAMIKAICDEDPPEAGPDFSKGFNAFIRCCLAKEAGDRLTAKQLLQLPFIMENVDDTDGDVQMHSDSDKSRSSAFSQIHDSGNHTTIHRPSSLLISAHSNSHPHNAAATASDHAPPPQSPMTARSATAAVVRKASRDFSSPLANSEAHSRLDGGAQDEEETFPYSVHDIIREESAGDTSASGRYDPSGPVQEPTSEEEKVINSIRMEHLDRVLDKIAQKLQARVGAVSGAAVYDDDAVDPFLDAGDEEQEGDSLRATRGVFLDLAHMLPEEGENDRALTSCVSSNNDHNKFDSSLDSIDNLLFKEGGAASFSAETPDAKKEFRHLRDRDDYFPEGVSGAESDHLAAAKDTNRLSQSHSILKTSSSYKHDSSSGGGGDSVGPSVVPHRHITLRDTHSDYHPHPSFAAADEKRGAPLEASHGKSKSHIDFGSSGRSVHFSDPAGAGDAPAAKKNLRSRLNMRALELEVIEDEGETGGSDSAGHSLPKPSSYFISSSSAANGAQAKEDDPGGHYTAPAVVDYCNMLPKLNARGMVRWSSLASQLHLPLHLVRIAVKAKLGALVDLDTDTTADSVSPRDKVAYLESK